jgi:hypothetical protein
VVFGSALLQVPDIEARKRGEFSTTLGLRRLAAKKLHLDISKSERVVTTSVY